MLNHIVIMGRLTRDPELRTTPNGVPVASFTVAVDQDYTSKDSGERQTDFINCVAWRSTGEFVSKYFSKGSMIVVSGRLQVRNYTDRDGNKRTAAEIVADNVYFGESKRRDDGGDYNRGNSYGNSSYGGNDYGNSRSNDYGRSESSYRAPSRDSFENARKQASSFHEIDDGDDGDLPF